MAKIKRNFTDSAILESISGWNRLNESINKFSETDLEHAMDVERKGRRRTEILRRLHQKFNRLRVERERRELFGG